ncbi:hypothetical protein VIGAN_11152600 [Vigna angularis var. angularis]|uniref:Uncharacterized protein n=1 Tax=Vigna angularis var. angularis TaxID=157739 RepID=A0A0S3TAT4_PHAAN|nr:hypothetical protein VIGAN_11152600 [Vigna angularis var. angularis]
MSPLAFSQLDLTCTRAPLQVGPRVVLLDRELCAAPPSKMLGRGMFLIEANLMLPPSMPGGPSCWTRDDSWMLLPVHSFIQAGQRGVISVCTPPLCWMLKLLAGPTQVVLLEA